MRQFMQRAAGRYSMGLACVLGLVACGKGDNYLDGSLGSNYDLSFDLVRVRLYPTELSIEYVSGGDTSGKVALRVVVAVPTGGLAANATYDIKTVQRVGYSSALPSIDSGTVQLDAYGAATGDAVKGSFEAIFSMPDTSKTTLRGGFSASMVIPN